MEIRHLVRGLVALAVVAAGCGSSSGSACDPPITEDFDPQSIVHVAPGTPVDYLTDPPTSGPHAPGPPPDTLPSGPVDPAVQLGWIESGAVLIQYDDVEPDVVAELERRFGDGVVVAPNPELPAAIVVTASLTKLVCRDLDAEAIDAFVAAQLAVSEADTDHLG